MCKEEFVPRDAPGSAMFAEVHEQPERVQAALEAAALQSRPLAEAVRDAAFIVLLGRGSSRSAATYGAYALQTFAGKPALVASPADLAWGASSLDLARGLVVAISQSGESTEMVAAGERVIERGARLIVVTNSPDATLPALVEEQDRLLCHAGAERAVPATKSFTTSLACLLALAQAHDPDVLRRAAEVLPTLMQQVLDDDNARLHLDGLDGFVLVGEGFGESVAEEGAIKFREVLKILVASLETSEFLHGSITSAQPGLGVVAIATDPLSGELAAQVLAEAAERQAATFSVGPTPIASAAQSAVLPDVPAAWAPFLTALVLQLATHARALADGLNPDAPPGLKKVTRIRSAAV